MITVYRWEMRSPVLLSRSGFSRSPTGFRVGHISIMVTGGSPAGSSYMAWSPTEQKMSSAARKDLTLEKDNEIEHGKPIETIRVGSLDKTLDESKMKTWWNDLLKNPPRWTLYNMNCSQLVVDALRAGGSDDYLPDGMRGYYIGKSVVWRPWIIPNYVRAVNVGLTASQ